MTPSSDEDLMLEYQGGSSAAFDELYQRYEQKIYNYLSYLVRDIECTAELFQDTFLQLHRSRASYDPARGFAPWIFRIARNLGLNELRRLKRRRGLIDEGADAAAQPDVKADPERELVQKTMRKDLAGALRDLGDDQREAILLRRVEIRGDRRGVRHHRGRGEAARPEGHGDPPGEAEISSDGVMDRD